MDSVGVAHETPIKKNLKALQPFKIPPSPFLESLGYGTGVSVWKLKETKSCHQNSPWAVKNVRKNMSIDFKKKYENLIANEASILRTLNHENIIGFRDYMTADDGRKCLAMELGGQSLGDLIEERLENDLGPYPPHLILRVALDVSKALEYLHDKKNILHGDIKPYNIVVKNNFGVVKLCDFGVSIKMDENGAAHNYVGTIIYSAPECQKGANIPITCKSDIFSLGLVLWEMMSLIPPHTDINECGSDDDDDDDDDEDEDMDMFYDSEDSFLLDKLEEKCGTRPNLPDDELGDEYSSVIAVFFSCTEHDPCKRPTAHHLVKHLKLLNSDGKEINDGKDPVTVGRDADDLVRRVMSKGPEVPDSHGDPRPHYSS